MTVYFKPAVFQFLRDLEANNEKTWWERNKPRYAELIQQPALDFIENFGERLCDISPHFVASTNLNGGSLMRPYRDVRFSQDKTPYKTNVGIQFRHERGKDVHAPGFYVHIEPSQNFAGAGLWHPETKVARQIRQAINDNPTDWGNVAHTRSFTETWSLGDHDDDRLQRIPKDLDPDHPYPDDLRLRSFTAGTRLTQKSVTSAVFADDLLTTFKKAAPYTRFLCEAIGVPF
ncbi:MAG TPA: TIGR02453 family protein [Acidimicrobiia bacterium]|nr:TIGR02453 family protein [Acidimicrobiia bacterium]